MTSIEQRLRKGAPGAVGFDAARFAARAAEEGLIDVAYAHADSPLGPLLLATTPRGLACVSYSEFRDEEQTLERLAARLSPRVLEAPERLDDVRRQLDDYFAGRRRDFSLAIDWGLVGEFSRRVLSRTAEIPFGSVATYGEVARGIGSPGAARATGNALGANPMPIVVPCHRVVASGGKLGGYTGGLDRKKLLLTLERGEPQL
ncbi:MAG: methylated-DNA-[protein]-cysteine S-methyltransferase [Thermoleophilaceae bacterium]|jgi:methylated-DNA-[protein]-cysteine S-methyltransferase|nr:methylated-DNA-[protein]-cysteine S-methyltransferase [Thermoleophilaceae bacterium]